MDGTKKNPSAAPRSGPQDLLAVDAVPNGGVDRIRPRQASRPLAIVVRDKGIAAELRGIRAQLGASWRIEMASEVRVGIRRCLDETVDRLYLHVSTMTADQLTAISFLRRMRPRLHVVLLAEEDLAFSLRGAGIADEVRRVDSVPRFRGPRGSITFH